MFSYVGENIFNSYTPLFEPFIYGASLFSRFRDDSEINLRDFSLMFNVATKYLSRFSSPGRLINIFPDDPVFLRNIFSYDESGQPNFVSLPFLVSTVQGSSRGTIFRTESVDFVSKILMKYRDVSLNELIKLILSDRDYQNIVVSKCKLDLVSFSHVEYLLG